MEIKLIETGTNNDLENVGYVITDCITVGEFVAAVNEKFASVKRKRITVGGCDYMPEMAERKIEQIFYSNGYGGLVFRIKPKFDFTMNNENLIPMNKRSKEEARESGRIGGIASGESRRKKKRLSQLLEMMFEKSSKSPEYETIADELVGKALAKELKNPTFITIKMAQDILGESVQKHEFNIDGKSPEERLMELAKNVDL